jgi:hypothetical protein
MRLAAVAAALGACKSTSLAMYALKALLSETDQ